MTEADFGAFRFDAELERYESTVEIDGAQIAVRVASEAFADKGRLREAIGVIARERERFLDHVVDDLLEDKNDGWLRDGEDPLSEQEFRRRIALDAIEIGPGGEVELLIEDDDMFWGHELILQLDSDHQIVRVNLEG